MDVSRNDGEVHELVSRLSLQRSIQRYLEDNSSTNVMKGQDFTNSSEVPSAHQWDLVVNNAKENRPQAARALTEDEEVHWTSLGPK